MSAVNRHLRGDTREVEIPVHGHTVVEKGDFMWINTNGYIKSGNGVHTTADWYGFPVSLLGDCTTAYFVTFGGIAMKGSESGTTENIPMATAGIFRYPLKATTGVTLGQVVAGATSATLTLYDQKVVSKTASEFTDEYETGIGMCVKTEAGATKVDFELITRFSGVSYAQLTDLGI